MVLPFWLDANVFIEAKNRWYSFELAPKFWALLSEEVEAGSIFCPKAVYDELVVGKDQLSIWIRTRRERGLCVAATSSIQEQFRLIADHVMAKYQRNQYEEFLSGADPWLIATAKIVGGTVVTGESESRKRKIRVPAICRDFSVPYTDTPGMVKHFNKVIG